MIKTDTDIITIAVEHHPAGLTTAFPCHFQRFHGEPAVRRERHGPAHWFSCEQVENSGEVRPALTRSEVRSRISTFTDLPVTTTTRLFLPSNSVSYQRAILWPSQISKEYMFAFKVPYCMKTSITADPFKLPA